MSVLRQVPLVAALLIGLHSAAYAGDAAAKSKNLKLGMGVICDTAENIQSYLALYVKHVEPEKAVKTVNEKSANSGACGIATVAFIAGNNVGSVSMTGGVMRIVKIDVIALKTSGGWVKIPATPQYTALFEKLDEA